MLNDKKILKENLLNCSLDLQRSAVSFYLNPQGRTHRVFLLHALRILRELNIAAVRKFLPKVKELGKETNLPAYDANQVKKIADDILTLGILLKTA